jgi:hypothetical protein
VSRPPSTRASRTSTPGTKSLYRYTFEHGKFAVDPTWGSVPNLKSGQTVSVDPASNLIFVMDAGARKIGAVALANGKLSLKWSQDQTTLSFTTLVGPKDQRILIGTDIPIKFFKQLKNYSSEAVVWRDAATGKELARSDDFPKMSSGILVTPGYAGLQYFLTAYAHIIELQVNPAGSG